MADSYEFSAVLGRMLSKVPDTIDKREGSIIYNALAPTAYALAAQSYMLGHMANLLFADTAEGEWLDRVVYDFGLEREAATRALRKITCADKDGAGIAGLTGKRFAINELTFQLTAAAETAGVYQAECEQYGTQGNCYSGAVLPVDNISGLGTAVLDAAPLIAARDDESDDDLRARFYEAVRQTPFGGNKADYREKHWRSTEWGRARYSVRPNWPPAREMSELSSETSRGKRPATLWCRRFRACLEPRATGWLRLGIR